MTYKQYNLGAVGPVLEKTRAFTHWINKMAEDFEGFQIDERVLIDRWKATVKFVGHVHGQQGIWVGLDWDDAERGQT